VEATTSPVPARSHTGAQDGTHTEVSERAGLRRGSTSTWRVRRASSSLSKVECDQRDQRRYEQEDRVHWFLLKDYLLVYS
jgi:hypothetical protein